MKSSVIKTNVYVNDQIVSTIQDLEPYTLYVNPYFVITEFSNADKVSKHYYMGTQRVASELAVQTTVYSPMVGNIGSSSGAASTAESFKTLNIQSNTIDQGLESQVPVSSNDPWLDNLNAALTEFGEATLTQSDVEKELPTIENIYPDLSPQSSYKTTSTVRVIYWYHPDYIGNVDLVTDMSGQAYEFFLYNPWGENLYEWNSGTSTWTSPYRFNGKELDQETGFHYYGARYHEPKLSVWLSVDPLAHQTDEIYQFASNNPIYIIDPDGRYPYTVYVRSFHPDATFGGGFMGDNRTFSLEPNVSSRIAHKFTFDPNLGKQYNGSFESNFSMHPLGLRTAVLYNPTLTPLFIGAEKPTELTPDITKNDEIYTIKTGYFGKNPLTWSWFTPAVDVHTEIKIGEDLQSGILTIQARIYGDNSQILRRLLKMRITIRFI